MIFSTTAKSPTRRSDESSSIEAGMDVTALSWIFDRWMEALSLPDGSCIMLLLGFSFTRFSAMRSPSVCRQKLIVEILDFLRLGAGTPALEHDQVLLLTR
jgi:hypothetical protein